MNYGLRYEAQINPQPDEPNPRLPGSDQIPSDTNNFAPRAGVLVGSVEGQSRRRALQHRPLLLTDASAADRVAVHVERRGPAAADVPPTSVGAPIFPNNLAAPPTGVAVPRTNVNIFDPEFQNPRTFQTGVGIERELFRDLTVFGGLRVRKHDEPATAARPQHRTAVGSGRRRPTPLPEPAAEHSFTLIDQRRVDCTRHVRGADLCGPPSDGTAAHGGTTAGSSSRRTTPSHRAKTTTRTSGSSRTSSIRTGRTWPPSTPGRTTTSGTTS